MVAAEKTVNTINILHSKPKQMATDLEIPYWKIWHPLQSDHSAQSSDWGFHLVAALHQNIDMNWETPTRVPQGSRRSKVTNKLILTKIYILK